MPGPLVASKSVRDLVASSTVALGSALESRWIVAIAARLSTSDLVARPDSAVASRVADAVQDMVHRRLAGEPLQYVLGTWAFRTLELRVDPRVLIPRPETEQVAAVALEELSSSVSRVGQGSKLVAADLGTGSGAIALSLAAEYESTQPVEVWATDVSAAALDLFGCNLADLARRDPGAASRVRVARGSWFEALPADLAGRLTLVVSNPPYVSEAEWEALDPEVRDYEPRAALVPGPTGFEALELLLEEAPRWLAPGGSLVVELAPGQARSATNKALELGYRHAEVRDDLARRQRMLVARLSCS